MFKASLSLATTSFGRPLGPTMAFQALKMKSTPASLVVGTLGRLASRWGAAIAYALTVPAWIWGITFRDWSTM